MHIIKPLPLTDSTRSSKIVHFPPAGAKLMPPAYVKTVREEIYYEYPKLISR